MDVVPWMDQRHAVVPVEDSDSNTKARENLLPLLFSLEAPAKGRSKKCCSCDAKTILYRCRTCFGGRMRCETCTVSHHVETPFHHVERWTGSFFERTTLGILGLKLYCGHQGAPCPSASEGHVSLVTIVDAGGIHELPVYECRCPLSVPHPSLAEQLTLMRIFPATDSRPENAATFQALEDFDKHNLCGKESILDYSEVVRRKTNSVAPHRVRVSEIVPRRNRDNTKRATKDFYTNFRRMTRQYRFLRAIKRSGRWRVGDLQNGDLAIKCPSCARPGVNMPETWRGDLLRYAVDHYLCWVTDIFHRRLIYSRGIAVDGNFVLWRNAKGGGPDKDPSLMGDYGFWAVQADFEKHIKAVDRRGNLADRVPKVRACL